jgi:hypothetical protein
MKWISLVVVFAITPSLAVAADGPFRVRNLAPASHIFGLPRAMGGEVLDEGAEVTFNTEIANNFTSAINGGNFGFFDGETTIFSLGYRRAVSDRFEWGVEMPYVYHSGGFLDGAIDGFHDLFNMQDGGRERARRYKIDYAITYEGQAEVNFQDSKGGLGDVRANVGYQLLRDADRGIAVRGQLKAPTGDADDLTGSGAWDAAGWVELTDRRLMQGWGIELTLAGGLTYLGEGDIASDAQEDVAAFGHLGMGYRLGRRFSFRAQMDGHTKLIDTGVDQVAGAALQGTLGARWSVTNKVWSDFTIIEDLKGDSTSDVAFQILIGARLGTTRSRRSFDS